MTGRLEIIPRERDEAAAFWCMRLADAPFDEREQAAFDNWASADPRNARAFEEAVAIWLGVGTLSDTPDMIGHRAEAVEALRRANARRRVGSGMARWRLPAAITACFAIFLIAAGLLLNDGTTRYKTGIGERRVVMLEDGSRLTLDASSEVEVRLEEEWRRLELVAGRAKFDVAHDPLRPFSVRAGNHVTIARGTSFSVELLLQQMRVVLYEGVVEVVDRPEEAGKMLAHMHMVDRHDATGQINPVVALAPGNELIASTTSTEKQVIANDMSRALSWEAGQLSFEGDPLPLAVERMNRYARDKIVVRGKQAASAEISGVFAAGDSEAFVEGVTALYPIAVSREPGRLILISRDQ